MRILIATGGTAGHINPAIAVASYIRNHEEIYGKNEFLFVGTADRMEAKIVPSYGFAFKTIEISGFKRKINLQGIKHNVRTLYLIMKSTGESKKIIKEFAPDVAVGFGGYTSGPVIRMANKLGIPTAIHEQNAFPGMTNKALAKVADIVMLTAEEAEKRMEIRGRCELTGLPVRGEILHANRQSARRELGLDDRPLILSTGGSLGADAINKAVEGLIVAHHKQAPYYHMHAVGQYGAFVYDMLKKDGVELEKEKNIMVKDYINNMDTCLAAADIVISRAGASSLSEIEALGKPSILIPSPNVSENHQYHNAMALVNRNAARIIEEKDLSVEKLVSMVDELLENKEELEEIGRNAKEMSIANASEIISNLIFSIIK